MGKKFNIKWRLRYIVVSMILFDIVLIGYLCINITMAQKNNESNNVIVKESYPVKIKDGAGTEVESNLTEKNTSHDINTSNRINSDFNNERQNNIENNRGKVTELTQEEFAMYVALIYCEVGAEPYETKLGVANVIINRMYDKRYPDSLEEVIYDPYQFSPVREGKLDVQLANYNQGKFTLNAHKECIEAAKEAMAGHNNVGDRIGFLTPDYLEKLFGGKYKDKLVYGSVAFFNV